MVVVLPTPFTPTTITTYGFPSLVSGIIKSSWFSALDSSKRAATSSFNIPSNSEVLVYLSFFTLSSIRFIIFRVVSTPTSLVTRTSSKLSRTSTSTVFLPATALVSFEKTLCFVFSNPLSRFSLFSFFLKNENMCDFLE